MRYSNILIMKQLLNWGDWMILLSGLALVLALMMHNWWFRTPGEQLLIRQNGHIFMTAALTDTKMIDVPGPLGITRIELEHGRARVLSDPGPRQICVQQGWLSHAGEAAICLPNRTSVEITGNTPLYDSLDY